MARMSPAAVGPELLTAGEIARHLRRGKRSGSGFTACCPAHDDRNPSLSLHERDGKILAHCHAGCSQQDVIAALQDLGLWPRREREWLSRSEWIEQRCRMEETRRRIEAAHYWADAIEVLLAELLDEPMPETDEDPPEAWIEQRRALTRARMEIRAAREHEILLLGLYADWLRRTPRLTAALAWAGERSERRGAERIWRWIDG
jgi:hypothetical protein